MYLTKMEQNNKWFKRKTRTRTVWAVSVKTKHFLSDFLQGFKNQVGMNLTAYEKVIEDGCGEAYHKLIKKYPNVYNVRFSTAQMVKGACEIICYGQIDEEIK